MFFRRKKQPDTDQTVLTETLRSLEDLIAETSEPAATDTGHDAVAGEPQPASRTTDPHPEEGADDPEPSGVTAAPQTPEVAIDDDVPVLTKVVFMPVPRVTVGDTAALHRSSSIDNAQHTIATELVNSVEQRLDTNGQSLDPGLTQELQDAVSASLEDWSVRTQEILLKRITPPTDT